MRNNPGLTVTKPPRLPWYLALGPVVQKLINANPRLKINQGVYFSTPKCFSTLIFGKTLHKKKSILKNKNKQKKLSVEQPVSRFQSSAEHHLHRELIANGSLNWHFKFNFAVYGKVVIYIYNKRIKRRIGHYIGG